MNYASKQKLALRQLMRSCFSLFLALAFIANSFLPAFAFGHNKNLIPDNLTYNDLSLIAYGYKTVLNEDIPKNQETLETANEINSKNKHITLDTVKSHLSEKVKNNIHIKSKLIEEAYQNKYQKVLPKGTALTLTNNQLANNNSYESIYKSLEKHSSAISYKPQATSSNLIAQADTGTESPENSGDTAESPNKSSPECNVINLELFDFYKASPQIKAKLEDPFSSITWSALSGSQSRFSALDHSLKNNKLAWSLLGYPTSFGLTYNGDGKFINITTSASAVNSLIGSTSDIAKLDNALVLGGFLPQAKFNTLDNEYYTVGAPPDGNDKAPYLYAFDTEDNKGVVKRSKDTYNHHYSGFSHGLDVTPNGLILLGIEDGNLTAALKEQNKAPLSIKNINQLRQFTKSYTNYFEVDDQTTNNPNHAFAIAGYVLPDTFKYSEILSLLKNNESSNYQSGLTIFSIDQSQENKEEIKILNKADFWGKELKPLLGFENTTVGGYTIKDNKLYISYFINNGVDFKKFYEDNYQKYIQQGKSWVDSNTGLPPSAFKYKDGLYDTRLAVFNLAQDGNTIKLDKIADISTVFDNPHCSGDSYGVSGPVKVLKNDIFIADKTYAGNVVRVFRYDPSSVFGIVPANIPYVIKLSNPRVENVLSESKYKPLAKDFAFSTSISDIAIDPESKILFVSLPFIEQSSDGLGKLHINGLLGSVYLSNSTEKCSKIVSSENCSEASGGKDEENEKIITVESAEEDLKTQKTIRQLSISEGSNTPSFVVDVNINPLEFSPSNFIDKHHVDLDVTSAVKSSTGIKISANPRGGNSATILKFNLSDDPYFPQVSRDVVKFNDSFNLLSRDGSNTYGKSTAIAGDGETLLALTNDDKVSKGFISSEKITPLSNIENSLYPRIVSSSINTDPKADEEFIILSQPPDNISAKPDSLIYVFKNKNRNPAEIEDILGNIEDQSFEVPIILDGPNFNIKYKSNNLQISDVKNINNPNEKVGLLTYRNSLKSEAISSYFKQILNIFPNFTEDPLNTDNFLKTFNGFSLVGIPEKADNIPNNRTYTNFYFNKLLGEAPQLAPPNNIADAILFSNNNDLYLAVSSYIPELASEVSTQEDPDPKDSDVPGISTKNLKLRFDAGNYNGKGGNAKDASFAGSLKWTDIANSGLVGNLINLNAQEAWVGKGATSDPYSLELTNPGNVSVTAEALDKLRTTNSFEAQGIIYLHPNRSSNINIFSWGAELTLVIDKDNNLIVTHNGVTKNTGAKVSTKEWHQISFGKSISDVFTVYIDNELAWSDKTTSILDRSRSTLIGGGQGQGTKWKLATFRVYSELLTDKEREDNYISDLYIYNTKSKIKELKAKKEYDINCGIILDTQLNEYISLESKSTGSTRKALYAQVQPSPPGGPPIPSKGSSSSDEETSSSKSTAKALNPGKSPYTISTYVKINEPEGSTALGDGTVIFTNRDNYSADSITVGTLEGKAVCLHDGPFITVGAQGNTNIVGDGKFHHVVCVRDGTKYQVWLDGVDETNSVKLADSLETSTFDYNNKAPITIGKHGNWGSNLGNFEISDLKIFNKALSKEEIIELGLNLSSLPKSAKSNLLSWCKFNEVTKNPVSCFDTDSFGNIKLNSALEATINGAKLPKCQKAAGPTVKLTDGAEGLTIKKITVAKSYTVNKSLVIPFSVESENGGVTITAEKPDWASISFDTKELIGTISGVPKEINTYEVKIIATDKKSLKNEQTISIDVIKKNNTGVNNPPEIKSPGNQTIVEKSPFLFLIPFSDPDGDDVEVTLSGLPYNLYAAFGEENFGIKVDDKTGIVSGPAKGIARYEGKRVNTYTVTATATDERGKYAETTFDITFINKNQPPVLLNKIDNLNIDDLEEFSTKALVASDPDGDKLIFKLKTVGNLSGNDYGFGGYSNSSDGGFGPGDDDYFGGGFSDGGYGGDEGDPADKFDLPTGQPAGGICGSFDGGGESGGDSGGNNSNGGSPSPRLASTKHLSNYRYQIYPGGGGYSGGDSYSDEGDNSNGGSYSGGDSGSSDDGTPTDPSSGAPGVSGGGSSSGNGSTSGPGGSPFEDPLISQLKDLGINYDRETGKFSGKTNFRVNPKKPRLLLKPVVIEADDGDYFDTNDKKVQENKEKSFEIAVETKNNPPQITENPGDILDFKEKNNDLYVKVKATDKDGNKITYKIKGLPKTFDNNFGLSFNSETGELTGKPDGIIDIIRKDKVKVDLTVVANDGLEDSGEAKFSITFLQNNKKPKLVQTEDVKVADGQEVNIQLLATDEDDDASSFTYYISCIPNGLIFDNKKGTITGIASVSADKLKEEYDIEIYAGDGHFNGYTDKDKFKYTVEKSTAQNKLYTPYEITQEINISNNLICSSQQNKNNILTLNYKPLLDGLKSLKLNEAPEGNIINKQPDTGHKEKFFSTTLPPNIQNSKATFTTSDTNKELFLDGACYECIPKEYKFNKKHIIPVQSPSPGPDTTPPTVSSLSPADNATGVSPIVNLVITFSEAVNPQAGVNNDIIIKKSSDNSTVETIDAQDAKVTGGGTSTITIDPATTLTNSTSYYVQIGVDAFKDLASNSYAGISDTTTWDFTTGSDSTAPTVSILSPADNATGVSTTANLVITFSEAVNPQAGVNNDIIIKKSSDNSTVETIGAQNAKVSSGGTTTITINPDATLANSISYYIQIGVNAFKDLASNSYAGISDSTTWDFTTVADTTAPTVSILSPADNATGVSPIVNLVITFSEAVNPQAGVNNDIIIKKSSDNSTVETIDAQDLNVTGGGTSTITINPNTILANFTSYYVQIGVDAFKDLASNSYAGISNTTSWNFTTVAVCGNSLVEGTEQCDDGNGINNDLCTNGCMNAVCMDSIVQDINGEQCDDGNSIEGDGCNNACMTEVGGGGGPAPESSTSTSTGGSSTTTTSSGGSSSTSSTSSSTSTTTGGSSTTSTGGTTMTTTGGSTSTSTSGSTGTSTGGSSSTSGGKGGTSTEGDGGKVNTCSFPTSDDDYNSIGQSGTSSESGGSTSSTSTGSKDGGGSSPSAGSTGTGSSAATTTSTSGGSSSTSTSSTTGGGGTSALPPPPAPEDTPGGFFFREPLPQITGKAQVPSGDENPCSKCINRLKDLSLSSDESKCTQCFACEKDCKIKEYFEGGNCNVCCGALKTPDNLSDRIIVQLDTGNIDGNGKQPPDAAREKVTNWNSLKGNHIAILNNFDFDSRGNWVGDGLFNTFALLFNGLKNYVSLPSTATKGLAENNIVTIETWIRLNKNNIGNFYIFSRGNFKLGINSKSNVTVEDKDTNVKVESNKWTHIVLVKDRANTTKLYLNSQETKWSEKINYIKEDPTTSIIGAGPNKDSGFLSGQIGYLNIYNHVLSKKDIEGIYTTSRTRFPEFDLLSEDDDKKDDKAGTLTGIIDNIPPGIKVDFNENTEYQAGDIIAATVVDELSPEGSNPAKNISSVGCILGGLNVDIEKEKNTIQRTSGIKLTKAQTLEFPGSLGNLQFWTIEALVKRNGAIASAPAGNAPVATDEFIIKGSTNILIDGKTQSLKINDLSSKSVFLPNLWNYLLITCDGANTKIYLNNVLEAIGPKIDLNLSNAKVGENLEGELAFIRLYNEGFITQDRIDRHYRYRFEPYNKSGLTYQLNFDGGPGYKWDIQNFKFTIPKFSKERPEKQRDLLLCSLNDVYGNKVSDELEGRILISNIIDEEEDKGTIIKTEKPSCDGSVVKCQEKDAKAECLLGNVKCQATEVKKKLEFIPHCCRKTSTREETCIPNDPTALCKLPEDAKGKSSGNDAGSSTSKKDDSSQGKQEEFTVTKTNENPLIKSSIFLKKVACKQSQRNFVVTGKEALTGQDVDYAYRSTKLTIYKVIQNKDAQAGDAFSLKLETEKETSREVPDKCTKPLRAGLAGPLNWNPLTRTLTLVDQHGLNLGVEYEVSFNNDGIKLKELNELNFAPAYDGYVTSTINTQAFDKYNTNYFLIAKPNDKNYNYSVLAYSIVDETKFDKKSDKDGKGKATNIDKNDDDKGKSSSDDNKDNQITTMVFIGGGGLFNPNANPFGADDKGDQEKAESAKGEKGKADQGLDKAKDKAKDKTEKDKDDEEDIKDQTDKMKSSSSSGGYSSSSSSGGKQEECLESSECTGEDTFCLDVNGKGKCINNPKEKISNQGYKTTGQCLDKEIKIEGRKKGKSGELYCVRTRASIDTNGKEDKGLEIKSGKDTTEQKEDTQRTEPPKKITPRDQIPQLIQDHGINEKTNKVYNSRGHPNSLIGLVNYPMNNEGSLKYKLRDPSCNIGIQDNKQDIIGSKFEGFIDGAYFTEYSGVLNNNIKNVQFNREEQSCKNYVDCKYNEGYFCLENSKDDKTGTCKFVCNNGKISDGIDSKGKSLPCPAGLFDSGLTDLSGRSICCTTKLDKDRKLLARGEATGCKNSVDCQKGEFCAYDNEIKNSTVCAFFNCNNSIVAAINCPKTPVEYFLLAGGPEGKLCCPISEVEAQSTSSSGGEGVSSSGKISSSSSGEIISSSSSGMAPSSSSGSSSSSSSSSSGSSSSSSSSGYFILLVLNTPEIYSTSLKEREANIKERGLKGKKADLKAVIIDKSTNIQQGSTLQSNTNIQAVQEREKGLHTYYGGELVSFTISLKGPIGADPQDVESYEISVVAAEKTGQTNDDPYIANLVPFEIRPKDIVSTTNINNFFRNPPPLYASLIREDSKGVLRAARGDIFRFTLPDARYLTKDKSTKLQILKPSVDEIVPEVGCSSKGGAVCGNELGVCLAHECYHFTKGSLLGKACCNGELPENFVDSLSTSSSGGEAVQASPQCDTKASPAQIFCKSTHINYVPYCDKRLTPKCEGSNPSCKARNNSSSSGGNEQKVDPKCVPLSERTRLYCDEVKLLEPKDSNQSTFSAADCVIDNCDYVKSLDKKLNCCKACGAAFDKITNEDIDSYEEEQILSCIGYEANGICGNKGAESCIVSSCYKLDQSTEEFETCCLKLDKEATRVRELVKQSKTTEDKDGAVYNIITFKDDNIPPAKIRKSDEDLVTQIIDLLLPSDPQVGRITINAVMKYREKNKIKTNKAEPLKIALVPGKVQKDETIIAREKEETAKTGVKTCNAPIISSLKVADKGIINTEINSPIEIPVIVTDPDNDIDSVTVSGGGEDFEITEQTKDPSYNFTSIAGTPTTAKKQTFTVKATDTCGKSSSFTFDIQPQEIKKDVVAAKDSEEAKSKDEDDIPKVETPKITKAWLPTAPIIQEKPITITVNGNEVAAKTIELQTTRAAIVGSRLSLELTAPIDVLNLNPDSLKVTWVSAKNEAKEAPPRLELLPNGIIKLTLIIDKNEPEGTAKIIVSSARNEKNILAQSEINIIKSLTATSLSEKIFGVPGIAKAIIHVDPTDKQIYTIVVNGKNFIGKRAKISGTKLIVPKKNNFGLFDLTVAEFRNSALSVTRTYVMEENNELIIVVKLPEGYSGAKEELFISTPVGQAFTEIELPPIK